MAGSSSTIRTATSSVWEDNGELRAASFRSMNGDRTGMCFDDALADRQPDAARRRHGIGTEWLEDRPGLRGLDAGPFIGNRDDHSPLHRAGGDAHGPVGRAVTHGVLQQVREHLIGCVWSACTVGMSGASTPSARCSNRHWRSSAWTTRMASTLHPRLPARHPQPEARRPRAHRRDRRRGLGARRRRARPRAVLTHHNNVRQPDKSRGDP